jgi:hypothetical protein
MLRHRPLVAALAIAASVAGGCSDANPTTSSSNGNNAGASAAGFAGMGAGGTAAGSGGIGGAQLAGASGSAGLGGTGAGSGGYGGAGSGGVAAAGGVAGNPNGGGAGSPSLHGLGTISYERWNDIPGELVSLVPVAEPPDFTSTLTQFQAPDDVGQDFAARVRGFLTAPATGDYTFWISSDDNSELNLSVDEASEHKQRIAHITGSPAWTGYREWTKFPTQKSEPVALVAGRRYYIEALLKEDIAEDHLAVGWLKPGETGTVPSEIIPGAQLSPVEP